MAVRRNLSSRYSVCTLPFHPDLSGFVVGLTFSPVSSYSHLSPFTFVGLRLFTGREESGTTRRQEEQLRLISLGIGASPRYLFMGGDFNFMDKAEDRFPSSSFSLSRIPTNWSDFCLQFSFSSYFMSYFMRDGH